MMLLNPALRALLTLLLLVLAANIILPFLMQLLGD